MCSEVFGFCSLSLRFGSEHHLTSHHSKPVLELPVVTCSPRLCSASERRDPRASSSARRAAPLSPIVCRLASPRLPLVPSLRLAPSRPLCPHADPHTHSGFRSLYCRFLILCSISSHSIVRIERSRLEHAGLLNISCASIDYLSNYRLIAIAIIHHTSHSTAHHITTQHRPSQHIEKQLHKLHSPVISSLLATEYNFSLHPTSSIHFTSISA